MKTIGYCAILTIGGLSLGTTGCHRWGTSVWTPVQTEDLRFDPTAVTTLEVRTHNGFVECIGTDPATADAHVTVKKKAGGRTLEDAEEAMAAVEIINEAGADGTHHLGWRWRIPKERHWSAQISFAITAPARLRLDVETHNGEVRVEKAAADVTLVTHNGEIEAAASGGKLFARTHNGEIDAHYEGSDITLLTHNGEINADLSRCGPIRGEITTHNGAVDLSVSEKTSAELSCRTHNGRIVTDESLATESKNQRELKKTLGNGGPPLQATTHNGRIRVSSKRS